MADGVRSGRMRLDEALVAAGLATSRARARDMVLRGGVLIDGEPADKPARTVLPEARLAVADPGAGYVSRAAVKLAAGLDAFGFDPAGLTVLDLGASTGGFTQVLLERGANAVIAVDVGHGQLHASLAADPRVRLHEGLNARALQPGHLEGSSVGGLVADLSFISLTLALSPALALVQSGSWGVFLVKPQFEVGREALGKGGIVRDPTVARMAVDRVSAWLSNVPHWTAVGFVESPLPGGDGNTEFLLGARRD